MTMRKEEQPIVERLREGIDLRPDFFGEEPPVWAQDPFNNDMAEKCGRCGSWAEVVRPGKTQCPCCGDDDEPALRLEAASTLEALQAEIERLAPMPTGNEHLYGVCYRDGPNTPEDYDEAIEALRNAKRTLIAPDGKCCSVCEDSGHTAEQCHHNPLILARRWAKATRLFQCYHCGFIATSDAEAREHFGYAEADKPACLTTTESEASALRKRVEELEGALSALLDHVDQNTCGHEDTRRGGTIWTICNSCGQKWADDEGGFEAHVDAEPVRRARTLTAGGKDG